MSYVATLCYATQDKTRIEEGARRVLTPTQLRTARAGELERLKRRIEAELQRRREAAEGTEGASREVLEKRDTPGGIYQWELVACGHKERCKKCKSGKKHGPYLYRYFYKNGKYTSQYIRLKDLDKHPDAPPRPAPLSR